MNNPTEEYISFICSLYRSSYDDRIENTVPPTAGGENRTPGEDWMPGVPANHKSLISFQRELEEQGIKLSTSKIKKILITGGLWTTETSRTIQELFNRYTTPIPTPTEHGDGAMSDSDAVKRIAEELDISTVSVSVNLPYKDVVYNLPEPSANAMRCRRWKERKAKQSAAISTPTDERENGDDTMRLWKKIIASEGETFTTSGRGSRPGITFTYTVSRSGGAGGRHYNDDSVDGYGNELWIIRDGQRAEKSISVGVP